MTDSHLIHLTREERQFFSGREHFCSDGFQHSGNGTETVGLDFAHIIGNGSDAFGIINTDTFALIMIVHRAFVDMAEWQETEHFMFLREGHVLDMCQEIGSKVSVRQHHTFGIAGGA